MDDLEETLRLLDYPSVWDWLVGRLREIKDRRHHRSAPARKAADAARHKRNRRKIKPRRCTVCAVVFTPKRRHVAKCCPKCQRLGEKKKRQVLNIVQQNMEL